MEKLKLKLKLDIKPSNIVSSKTRSNIHILNSKAEGIIERQNDGSFLVISSENYYPITSNSYSNKGKKIIYSRRKDKTGNYIKIVRTKDCANEMPTNFYIPFKHGIAVKGRIISFEGKELFQIISCYNPSVQEEVLDANLEFDNYRNDE